MAKNDEKVQEILKTEVDPVYKELAAKVGEADSIHMPHMLARLATLEQAKILNMIESPIEEITEKLSLDKETVENHLQVMSEKGLAHKGRTGWHLIRSWRGARDTVASSNSKYDDDLFFDLTSAKEAQQREDMVNQVVSGELSQVRQAMRVVPRWQTIKDIPGILPCEDVKGILEAATLIAVVHCPCKNIERHRDCRDEVPVETCIVFGRNAEYNLERGAARELSYDEAIELIDSFGDHQLVHTTGNRNTMPTLLCNCHNCCCGAFIRNSLAREKLNQYAIVKSRFIAEDNPEECRGCKTCVDTRCPVGAISMKYYPEYDKELAYTDPEECIGCGLCVLTCPAEARKMKLVRPPEHIPSLDDGLYATF